MRFEIEWISVKDMLPCGYIEGDNEVKEPAEYIVHIKHAEVATVAWFLCGRFMPLDGRKWADEVDFWLEMPLPPKD